MNKFKEYWLLGKSFIYAEIDSNYLQWKKLIIHNPDYIIIKRVSK